MNIGQLDAAIRAGAVGTILLLAWLLFGARRRVGLPAALFAPLALCLSGFVIGNTPIAVLTPAGLIGAIAHTVSGFAVVFLWWFCLSCFDSRFSLKGGVLGVGLAWAAIAALDRGLLGDALAGKPDAIITDNGKRFEGRQAIHQLLEDEVIPVKAIFMPDSVREEDGAVVVEGPAHGDFPGSPLRFTYRFQLTNSAIETLEITI